MARISHTHVTCHWACFIRFAQLEIISNAHTSSWLQVCVCCLVGQKMSVEQLPFLCAFNGIPEMITCVWARDCAKRIRHVLRTHSETGWVFLLIDIFVCQVKFGRLHLFDLLIESVFFWKKRDLRIKLSHLLTNQIWTLIFFSCWPRVSVFRNWPQ